MKHFLASLLVAGLGFTGAAHAEGHMSAEALGKAVKARQAVMQLYAFNLGTLGGMAKGAIEYDVAVAQAAAGNLVKLSTQDHTAYWPKGSAQGEVDGTKALPAMWDNMDDVVKHAIALSDGAKAAAAATDLDGLRAAMGTIGGSCGGCHKVARASN